MRIPAFSALLAFALALAGHASAQQSKAARYLADQELARACPDGGAYVPGGLIEADLTRDGRNDLIIAHEGILCKGASVRSDYCGAQVCTFKVYVREAGLLVEKLDMLGGGISLAESDPPMITGYAHGGDRFTLTWDGTAFR